MNLLERIKSWWNKEEQQPIDMAVLNAELQVKSAVMEAKRETANWGNSLLVEIEIDRMFKKMNQQKIASTRYRVRKREARRKPVD